MLTVQAVCHGDQAQEEDDDAKGQWDPDQQAAGSWRAGRYMVQSCPQLSTQHHAALAALAGGVQGGKGRKARHREVEAMTTALGYPLEDALHLKAQQGA